MEVLSVIGWLLYAVLMFVALYRVDQWVDKVKPNPPPTRTVLQLIDGDLSDNLSQFTEKMDVFVRKELSTCPLGTCCPDSRPDFPFCPPGRHEDCPYFQSVRQ